MIGIYKRAKDFGGDTENPVVLPWGGVMLQRKPYKNMQVEGTPRRESGYRPTPITFGPDDDDVGRLHLRVWLGPLCKSEAEALAWAPPRPEGLNANS